MSTYRIALANIRPATSPEDSVQLAKKTILEAGTTGAKLVCFPECFLPGYRALGKIVPPPDKNFLERAWSTVAAAAAQAKIHVILGTERIVGESLLATTLMINDDGTILGFQDKVQIDPTEDGIYATGSGRAVFHAGELTFGVVICHEGWRYPETVRWAARNGAQIVFHPHLSEAEPGSYHPRTFADPANSFHEKAALCRAAENTCYFATVNYATPNAPTTSAIASPDGTLMTYQPYGQEGLLVADIDLSRATRLLAMRYKTVD